MDFLQWTKQQHFHEWGVRPRHKGNLCVLISDIIREVLVIDWDRNSNNVAVRHRPFYAGFQIIVFCTTWVRERQVVRIFCCQHYCLHSSTECVTHDGMLQLYSHTTFDKIRYEEGCKVCAHSKAVTHKEKILSFQFLGISGTDTPINIIHALYIEPRILCSVLDSFSTFRSG